VRGSGTLGKGVENFVVEGDELINELRDDASLFLTDAGDLGYADAFPLDGADTAAGRPAALPLGVDASALSSRPSSSRVIYLDFDGHVTVDAGWQSVGAPSPINSAPFDLDGAPGSFSAGEQAVMLEVWQRVSEDYAPFDVDVTTIDPGVEALRRSGPSDADYGQRVVISPSNFVASGVLGIALLGSFDDSADRPAFVFSSGASVKTIAEAVSHETGHTFGLSHDTFDSQDYYDGHGSWAPIMGRGIAASKPVTQWSRGEYAGATQFQDDLALIDGYTLYRPDDHGGTTTGATPVASSSTTAGVIGRTGDRDVFAVDVGAGALGVTLRPPPGTASWSNLLAQVAVRNSAGALVAAGSPTAPSGWNVALNPTVPAGRYTIEVDPTSWLTPDTGFSTYGSLGAYELVVAGAAAGGTPPSGTSTLTAVTPTRLVDTRTGVGGYRRVGAGRQVVIQVTNGVAVPNGATAAVFSIAAVNPSGPGYITAYPCSSGLPDTSTLNYVGGQTVANNTIAALSGAGQLCVWTYAETDILVDITGWLGPGGTSRFTPLGPSRVVDTRSGVGGTRLGPGATLQVDLNGVVPSGTTAVALNATAVGASEPAFLTVFPCGPLPGTSTINYVAGEARPNNTIVGLTGGRFCVYSYASTDVLVDLVGSFGPTGFSYQPTAPTRVMDTRQFRPPLVAGEAIVYSVSAPALGTTQPGAAFVNVTAANHTVPGYVTTYDCGVRRDTSTLNQQVGQAAANAAIVSLTGLQSCAWMYGGGDLIVDVNGWWVP
jgi:hypothetical protein